VRLSAHVYYARRVVAMNSQPDRRSPRFAFRIAMSLCASVFLTLATVAAAQTKDYPRDRPICFCLLVDSHFARQPLPGEAADR